MLRKRRVIVNARGQYEPQPEKKRKKKRLGPKGRREQRRRQIEEANFDRAIAKADKRGVAYCCFCGYQLWSPDRKLDSDSMARFYKECPQCKNWQQWRKEGPRFPHPRIDKYQAWIDSLYASSDPEAMSMVPKGAWRPEGAIGSARYRSSEHERQAMLDDQAQECPVCHITIPAFWNKSEHKDGTLQWRVEDNSAPVHVHVSAARQAKMQAGRLRAKQARE